MIAGITKVRNESLILQDTLEHNLKFCDHIYLYDDCSEDNTVEIARSFDNVTVTMGATWDTDRARVETIHRRLMLNQVQAAKKYEFCLCVDADERFVGLENFKPSSEVAGYRFDLYDGYLTKQCSLEYTDGKLELLPRMWGPECRKILMLFRPENATYIGLDQREPVLDGIVSNAKDVSVKHFGKCLSVSHWEETCNYYAMWPKYKDKWNARRGRAIHTVSDFGAELKEWSELNE